LLAKSSKPFPHNLSEFPVLLPTAHTAMRDRLELWFEQHQIKPHVVGEFEDSALLKTFGASGMGVFPAAESVQEELMSHYAVQRMGSSTGVTEHFFAIGTEKKVQHPLVQRLLHPSPHHNNS
jgi:LysR family transcriptional activator of nhaA